MKLAYLSSLLALSIGVSSFTAAAHEEECYSAGAPGHRRGTVVFK